MGNINNGANNIGKISIIDLGLGDIVGEQDCYGNVNNSGCLIKIGSGANRISSILSSEQDGTINNGNSNAKLNNDGISDWFNDFIDGKKSSPLTTNKKSSNIFFTGNEDTSVFTSLQTEIDNKTDEALLNVEEIQWGSQIHAIDSVELAEAKKIASKVIEIMANSGLAIQEEGVDSIFDERRGKATLKFIESNDHLESSESNGKIKLNLDLDYKPDTEDYSGGLLFIKNTDTLEKLSFYVEIIEKNGRMLVSCQKNKGVGVALDIFTKNPSSDDNYIECCNRIINAQTKKEAFEFLEEMIVLGYFNNTLGGLFTYKN